MKPQHQLALLAFFCTTPVLATEKILEVVRNHTRVNILDSNNVGLRPGSIYDNITIFESLLEWPKPGFNYEFIDSGLGAAEPLYPMYQKGHQGSWLQLVPAFFSSKARHIDHFTSIVTPEGCKVEGLYGLRHISEYPKNLFVKERVQGYEQIVVRLEHYTRLNPGAQCGRHMSHDPDPNFDPMAFVRKYKDAMTFADFPAEDLERFEWKISAIHHLSEERNKKKWPRFDLEKLKQNTLWFYPAGHQLDFGIDHARPQPGLQHLKLPRHLLLTASPHLREALPLGALVREAEFQKLMSLLNGQPTPNFDASQEAGGDTLRLADVTNRNIYTSGLYLEHIQDVVADVSNPNHFSLVAITIKPFEPARTKRGKVATIPQLRFVYQMMDPRHPDRPFEELYFHLRFDAVDANAPATQRRNQENHFLQRIDALVAAQENEDPRTDQLTFEFVREFTQSPIESLNFSSSLTGIWTFGSLSRTHDDGELKAVRMNRQGIDIGYYSSTYDNDLFRKAIAESSGERKALLEKHMEDLTVTSYRDPKRHDPHAITFERVTCAQCHQTAGRDGVHVSFNDSIDRRISHPIRATQYFFLDADKQLSERNRARSNF